MGAFAFSTHILYCQLYPAIHIDDRLVALFGIDNIDSPDLLIGDRYDLNKFSLTCHDL